MTSDIVRQVCGSLGYMEPEMLRNEHYSYKVDNFSVSAIFYELVFGRVSFIRFLVVFITN